MSARHLFTWPKKYAPLSEVELDDEWTENGQRKHA
ncbi:MAG: hypothetical protein ACI83P_001937 [Janthinobacterium sp.]|jgi:hypothetical protein